MGHKEPHRAVRVPAELLDRAGLLGERLKESTELGAAMPVSVAAVVRIALKRGLSSMEADLAARTSDPDDDDDDAGAGTA